jgi:N-hydroxyarylamine O-acetyltransferase
MIDVPAYLDRIGYAGPIHPTAEVLQSIHRPHLFTVPFENLDIGLGRKIVCDEEAFLRKIVEQRRGGFCYEMNGAFAALLRAMGFKVTLLSARVPHEDGTESPEFDHLTLRVDLESPRLADVGFGESFVDPLRLETGMEQTQANGSFRIVEEQGSLHLERSVLDGEWTRQYSFTLQPRRLEEFAPMCEYHQTSPESPFTRRRLCTLATPDGRITLSDRRLLVTQNGKREERLLSEEERRAVLMEQFGIVL